MEWKKKFKEYKKKAGIGLTEKEKEKRYEQQQVSRQRDLERQQSRTELERSRAEERKFRSQSRPQQRSMMGGGNNFFSVTREPVSTKRVDSYLGGSGSGVGVMRGESYFRKPKRKRVVKRRKKKGKTITIQY